MDKGKTTGLRIDVLRQLQTLRTQIEEAKSRIAASRDLIYRVESTLTGISCDSLPQTKITQRLSVANTIFKKDTC
jgi:hypothetical protein